MIETFVFSSEHVFLNEDQTKIRQLLDYLKSRKQQIGMVFYDQAKMNQLLLEHHLADYLDFSVLGKKTEQIPQGLVDFLQADLSCRRLQSRNADLSLLQKF